VGKLQVQGQAGLSNQILSPKEKRKEKGNRRKSQIDIAKLQCPPFHLINMGLILATDAMYL
jgi:hypothetical protein